MLNQIGEIVPFDHNELYNFLKKEEPEIVLTHNPPYNFCDDMFNGQNVGTPATEAYIQENSPKLVLAGHIHEAGPSGNNPRGIKGVARHNDPHYGDTIIINPGNLGRFELLTFPELKTHMQFDYGTFSELYLEDNGTPKKVVQYSLSAPGRKVGKVNKLEEITF